MNDKYKAMIEQAAQAFGFSITKWGQDTDYQEPRPNASVGRVRITEDDEEHGLFADTEGELWISVVGAPEYNNERVMFWYVEDGMDPDGGNEVPDPLGQLELI